MRATARARVALLGLAALLLAVAGRLAITRDQPEAPAYDLLQQFDRALEKRPAPDVFSVVEATIGAATRRAILAKASTRIVFSVDVPQRAELRVSLGVPESVWAMPSEGMLLRILIARGDVEGPMQYYVRHLNPFSNRTDRGWQDVTVDLSAFAGQTIRLFFNTNFTPPAAADPDGPMPGLAVWGGPRILTR